MIINNPLVSVIINVHNGEKYIAQALKSVVRQTYTNWEIIVWDNLSVDKTYSIVKNFNEDKIKYIKGEKFLPLGLARNEAIRNSSGEYISILDCDDYWHRDKLKRQIELILKDQNNTVVYSNCECVDKNGKTISKNNVLKFFRGNVFNQIISGNLTPPWPTVLIEKSALISVGCFKNYKSAEDKDLLLKLATLGNFDYDEGTLAYYRIHENQLAIDYKTAVKEAMEILNIWKKDSKYKICSNYRKAIKKGEAKTLYKGGILALTVDDDRCLSREYALKSLKTRLTYRGVILLILTCFKPKRVASVLFYFRKFIGRGTVLLKE